jgi:hypothetical protein
MAKKSGLLNRFRPLAASATKEGINISPWLTDILHPNVTRELLQ